MLQIRRHKVEKQALCLQKAGRAEEDLPELRDGLSECRRAATMRRQRHDRLLGRREILGAHALHGPLEQRDRRLRPIVPQRGQEHIFRGPRNGHREKEKGRRAGSDSAHRPRLRLRFEGLQ